MAERFHFLSHLRAVDPAPNIARQYQITASPDLFGHTIVDTGWGRIESRLSAKRVSFASHKDAESYVRKVLKRRATAQKRIGTPYHPILPF